MLSQIWLGCSEVSSHELHPYPSSAVLCAIAPAHKVSKCLPVWQPHVFAAWILEDAMRRHTLPIITFMWFQV